jgi:hypothetical protein
MPNVKINFNQRGFANAVRKTAGLTIRRYIEALKRTILDLFRQAKHGQLYRKPGGGLYRAARPGEPPAERTGGLARSVREAFPDPVTGLLNIGADYASYVEKRNPYVRPALVSVSRRFGGGARARLG